MKKGLDTIERREDEESSSVTRRMVYVSMVTCEEGEMMTVIGFVAVITVVSIAARGKRSQRREKQSP